MSEPAAARLGPIALTAALDGLPDAVVIIDADWTVSYLNPAGADLLGRTSTALIGHDLWTSLPELSGTIFHGFLRHARTVGTAVTWQGFYAPTGRWLSASAAVRNGLLYVHARETSDLGDADTAGPVADAERDRFRYLAEVSESLIATLDTGESATRLAQLVVPRLADWATVMVIGVEGAEDQTARAHRDPAGLAALDTYLTGRGRGARDMPQLMGALASGEPMQLLDPDAVVLPTDLPSDSVRDAYGRLDPASCLFVPLRAHGETFGALSLIQSGDRPPHTEAEIALAVEVARRGALALDNARLYGRQLQVAEVLQRSLLFAPAAVEGLQIAVRYRPATTNALVGGDFYDVFVQPDGATVFVIGDVVGHNVDAAAAMGRLASAVRALAHDRAGGPAQTLTRVDGVLHGLGFSTLATALVARLELPTSPECDRPTLRWSSAGHLPPFLLQADGTVEILATPPERLLGTEEAGPRTDHEVRLNPGDTVVLVTDGLVEAGRCDIDAGLARLAGALAGCDGLPVEQLCDRLLERIVPGPADDDVALLAVRWSPT